MENKMTEQPEGPPWNTDEDVGPAVSATVDEGDAQLLTGNWNHIFVEGRKQVDRDCRFVMDMATNQVTHLDIQRGSKWQASSRAEREDLTDSLVNANPDAIDNPGNWELEIVSELPDWVENG
jgi:hypothetical protein